MPRKIPKNLDQSLPVFNWKQLPENLKPRTTWKRRRRKVRSGEQPVARLTWTEADSLETECHDRDGTVTTSWKQVSVVKECGLFSSEQTSAYQPSPRTSAIELFRRYFVELSSREHHIWWADGRWLSCHGPLREWQLKKHLSGDEKYGVRGGEHTRFLAIDLDLHNGDQSVFLDQLRVLLAEFDGKDGWHYQVANENAGGVHFIRCFRDEVRLEPLRANFRKRLQELDQLHPELAGRARAANMKTLGELEIFPDAQKGLPPSPLLRSNYAAGQTAAPDLQQASEEGSSRRSGLHQLAFQ